MAAIVGVHGAFHELWGPAQVLARWRPALQDGVTIAGGELADDAIALAFYGDVFRHQPADGGLDDERLREIARESGLAEVAQSMLGPDAAAVLAKAIGEDMLRRVVDQVGRYFSEPAIRAEVRARVVAKVGPDTRVLVAHSLGSIVAYEALRAHPEWPIQTFVTVGSPLGNAGLVQPHLESGLGWPEGISRWVNVTAPTDLVCANARLADAIDTRIEDAVVDNGHRGHDPEPYLCAQVTGAAVLAAMIG